ncbi:hypothetical protein BHE74_00044465 [Ensete ventricosum]|nr:hypothetical protein BHE74_00044465 [Ensete ventricosum]
MGPVPVPTICRYTGTDRRKLRTTAAGAIAAKAANDNVMGGGGSFKGVHRSKEVPLLHLNKALAQGVRRLGSGERPGDASLKRATWSTLEVLEPRLVSPEHLGKCSVLLFLGIDASDNADLTGHEEVVICETKGAAVQAEVLASDSEMFVEVESLPSRSTSWTGIAADLFNLEPFAFAEREFGLII